MTCVVINTKTKQTELWVSFHIAKEAGVDEREINVGFTFNCDGESLKVVELIN